MVRKRQPKTILITGGAGFIGSHLCDYFIHQGHRVVCMDNFLTGAPQNVAHLVDDKHFELIKQDVSKHIHFTGKIDTVFHFASPASPDDYLEYPIKTLKVGSLGTHNALGLAKVKRAKFVLASTSEVYGDPLVHPQVESYWGNVNPIGPRGVYDEAKRFAEALTLAYHRTHKIDVKIARIFNTYGPRMRAHDGRVIPNFIDQALHEKSLTVYGKGTQTRSFCYIDDLVNGLVRLRRSRQTGPINLGNPSEYTVVQMARLIIKLTGSRSKIIFRKLPVDDPKQRCPNIKLAKRTLDWQPQVGVEEGLRATIEYFRSFMVPKRVQFA